MRPAADQSQICGADPFILARRVCSSNEIAKEIEVSQKTIERDLEFMRDRLGVQIESDWQGHRLVKTGPLCECCFRQVKHPRSADN